MVWLVALFFVLLVAALARLFVMNARAIRHDVDRRFRQLEVGLEQEAKSLLKDLLDEQDRT